MCVVHTFPRFQYHGCGQHPIAIMWFPCHFHGRIPAQPLERRPGRPSLAERTLRGRGAHGRDSEPPNPTQHANASQRRWPPSQLGECGLWQSRGPRRLDSLIRRREWWIWLDRSYRGQRRGAHHATAEHKRAPERWPSAVEIMKCI